MKKLPILALVLIAVVSPALALDNCANLPAKTDLPWNGLEAVPAMGWSPDSAFTSSVSEANVKAQADLMVSSGLKASGYTQVRMSNWWALRSGGTIIANPATFPDGMAATIAYVHGDGLQMMVYSSPYTSTCANVTIGSGTFEAADATTFGSWQSDGLWYDGCSVTLLYSSCFSTEYQQVWQMMAQDIRATGRPMPMVMGTNSAPVGTANEMSWVISWAKNAGYNEVYPVNNDITTGGWSYLMSTFLPAAKAFHKWEQPGYFPFCEFLLQSTEASGIATFTQSQSQAQMGLYALWGCPLILSTDISTISAPLLSIYNNAGVIAVDQDVLAQAGILYAETNCGTSVCQIWVKPLKGGAYAIGLFNEDSASHTIAVNLASFGGNPDVYDLWAASDLGNMTTYSATVPACTGTNQCLKMLKVTPPAGAAHQLAKTSLHDTSVQ